MLLITGADGQLGRALRKLIPSGDAHFANSKTLDVSNNRAVKGFFDSTEITGVINCAAYTAVDKAEDDQARATTTNTDALSILGEIAGLKKIPLVHVSTDYVFDGTSARPYRESDPTSPVNFYGKTKLDGERAIASQTDLYAVVRTSWLYAEIGQNFVQTMLKLATTRQELSVVFDQIGSPTYAPDLAAALVAIVRSLKPEMPNIYHYSNEGVTSWYDFAKAIFEIKGLPMLVHPILSEQYPTRAKRPHYSVLDKALIKETFGLTIPHWRESLKRCLEKS